MVRVVARGVRSFAVGGHIVISPSAGCIQFFLKPGGQGQSGAVRIDGFGAAGLHHFIGVLHGLFIGIIMLLLLLLLLFGRRRVVHCRQLIVLRVCVDWFYGIIQGIYDHMTF